MSCDYTTRNRMIIRHACLCLWCIGQRVSHFYRGYVYVEDFKKFPLKIPPTRLVNKSCMLWSLHCPYRPIYRIVWCHTMSLHWWQREIDSHVCIKEYFIHSILSSINLGSRTVFMQFGGWIIHLGTSIDQGWPPKRPQRPHCQNYNLFDWL